MISLYGALARKFEKKYKQSSKNINIIANSVKEVMLALDANFPGVRNLIKKSGYYKVSRGVDVFNGKNVNEKEVELQFNDEDWHIMPIATGQSGTWQVIAGVLLVIIGIVVGYYVNPDLGTGIAIIGVGLIVSGITTMMVPNPGVGNYADREKPDERPSYLFDGPKNTVEPGLTIPVAYGETFIGSIVVSGGTRIKDI